jgi:hypothetical protein
MGNGNTFCGSCSDPGIVCQSASDCKSGDACCEVMGGAYGLCIGGNPPCTPPGQGGTYRLTNLSVLTGVDGFDAVCAGPLDPANDRADLVVVSGATVSVFVQPHTPIATPQFPGPPAQYTLSMGPAAAPLCLVKTDAEPAVRTLFADTGSVLERWTVPTSGTANFATSNGTGPVDAIFDDLDGMGGYDLALVAGGEIDIYWDHDGSFMMLPTAIHPVYGTPIALTTGEFGGTGPRQLAVLLDSGGARLLELYTYMGGEVLMEQIPSSLQASTVDTIVAVAIPDGSHESIVAGTRSGSGMLIFAKNDGKAHLMPTILRSNAERFAVGTIGCSSTMLPSLLASDGTQLYVFDGTPLGFLSSQGRALGSALSRPPAYILAAPFEGGALDRFLVGDSSGTLIYIDCAMP